MSKTALGKNAEITIEAMRSACAPTKALANRVKPMARGAHAPCPGLATAVAYTTLTSVNVMINCMAISSRI